MQAANRVQDGLQPPAELVIVAVIKALQVNFVEVNPGSQVLQPQPLGTPGADLADLMALIGVLTLTGGLALLAFAGAAGLVATCGTVWRRLGCFGAERLDGCGQITWSQEAFVVRIDERCEAGRRLSHRAELLIRER